MQFKKGNKIPKANSNFAGFSHLLPVKFIFQIHRTTFSEKLPLKDRSFYSPFK